MLQHFKTPQKCAEDLDAALDSLVFHDDGIFKAKTCFCCDCFLLHTEESPSVYTLRTFQKQAHLFKLDNNKVEMEDRLSVTIPEDVLSYYKYDIGSLYPWLQECVISPNACYDKKRKGFLICKTCRTSLTITKRYPSMGIKNGYMIGKAPAMLDMLSDEELSCISLVRDTAHVFTYTGGEATTIKGWHSMLDVDTSQIRRTLRGMDHSTLGFPDSITIVLEGPMTANQYRRLKKKANASRKNMLQVLAWFIENNCYYAEHFKSLPCIDKIPTPQIIDNVHIIDSIDANIELTEQMSMVFPDETLDETTGGFQSPEQFKKVISDINRENTTATLTSCPSTYVYTNRDNNFVKAFPRQFPYGIGGPNQMRFDNGGDLAKVDFVKYIQHVNNLSNLNFQTQKFAVLTWNILEKQEMVNRACLRVKANTALQKKIVDANCDEIVDYITSIGKGVVPTVTDKSEKAFLDTVNSITTALPHSNESAKANRKKAFSMQLRFGFPFVFFTVAPDDSSSYAVSVYTGLQFNPDDKLEDLSNKQFIERAQRRETFHIKYAGVGALWYRAVMDAIWKHVIGWNWATRKGCPGLYGIPEATMESTEEQA